MPKVEVFYFRYTICGVCLVDCRRLFVVETFCLIEKMPFSHHVGMNMMDCAPAQSFEVEFVVRRAAWHITLGERILLAHAGDVYGICNG